MPELIVVGGESDFLDFTEGGFALFRTVVTDCPCSFSEVQECNRTVNINMNPP
jgi:hypothetical protein